MSDVNQELATLVKSELAPKKFSTGSKGFYANGKLIFDGARYQANVMAVLLGSKDNPRARVQASAEEITAALTAMIEAGVPACTFRSGKTGYRVQGKVEAHGQRFQASAQAVRLS
jgi:hypothetical protein